MHSYEPEIEAKLSAFKAKCLRFRSLGYDRFAAARFVADCGSPMLDPVLDVGTGRGLFAIALAGKAETVVSVDADESDRPLAEALVREAGLHNKIRFLNGDAAKLPFPDAHFGCVAMMDVLHHLTDPEAVLAEMARLVRPSGSIMLADFDEEGFALLDTINREEGKEHPRLAVDVDFAVGVLTNHGFNLESRRSGHLHHVALLLKAP